LRPPCWQPGHSPPGSAISLYESAKTVTGAFFEAGTIALVAIFVLLFLALRKLSDVVLTLGVDTDVHDGGGRIGSYLAKFESLRNSGETVIIDGPCFSACTLILGSVPDDRICMTARARFRFHAAYDLGSAGARITNREATELMYSIYPVLIQNWLAEHGGLTPRLLLLRGIALRAFYKSCRQQG
jgi:hypothetical protein